jgi:hypothetical protein
MGICSGYLAAIAAEEEWLVSSSLVTFHLQIGTSAVLRYFAKLLITKL